MTYRAPVADIAFALKHSAGFGAALGEGLYGDLAEDVVEAVLAEAGRFATDVIAPLNAVGDRHGTPFKDGAVTTPPGWKEAYRDWAAAGWNGLAAPAQWGGQGLPHAVNAACIEMWNSAAMAFGLCPMLTMAAHRGAGPARHATRSSAPTCPSWSPANGPAPCTSPSRRPAPTSARCAPRPSATADGSYRLTGQKIFITWGDHDLDRQHLHLVLARTARRAGRREGHLAVPGPEVPGQRRRHARARATTCAPARIEHKLGIHGSPTCVMVYGEGAPPANWSARRTAAWPACSP